MEHLFEDLPEMPRGEQIKAVAQKAGPEWYKAATDFLVKFATEHQLWIAEDVTTVARSCLPEVEDERAWGHVIRMASRSGLIEKTGSWGYRANGAPSVQWRLVKGESNG